MRGPSHHWTNPRSLSLKVRTSPTINQTELGRLLLSTRISRECQPADTSRFPGSLKTPVIYDKCRAIGPNETLGQTVLGKNWRRGANLELFTLTDHFSGVAEAGTLG